MKKILFFICLSLMTITGKANQTEANNLLDKVAQIWTNTNGTEIVFTGTTRGTLEMKGNLFHITTTQFESWYDGTTLWQYLPKSKEVNVTTPTEEDMLLINPYLLFTQYKKTFNTKYEGRKKRDSQTVDIIQLTPKVKQEIKTALLYINMKNEPTYLKLTTQKGQIMEIRVKTIQNNKNYTTQQFTFDKTKHVKVEIIDLR